MKLKALATLLISASAVPAAFAGVDLSALPAAMPLPASYNRFFPGMKSSTDIPDMPSRPAAPRKGVKSPASPVGSPIYGYLYYNSDNRESGFYNIDTATGASTLDWVDFYTDWGFTMPNGWMRHGNVCGLNNFIFMSGVLSYNYVELDFETGEVIEMIPLSINLNDMQNVYVNMAYRDLDDRVYGYGYSDDGESMGFNSAPATDIDASRTMKTVDIEDVCVSMCYNVQTDLFYGVTTDGRFVSIDAEGNQTPLFSLNMPNMRDAVTGMAYNPEDGTYIWNAFFNDNTSAFYAIDPVAETATKLSDCPASEEYTFIINRNGQAASTAPGIPEITAVSFAGASASGTVTATLPSLTEGGATLSGTLQWELFVDGNLADSGSANAGSAISANAKDIADGLHIFALMVSKDGKKSRPAIEDKWVGNDYPSAPRNVTLTEEMVTWEAVNTSEHDGYVDFAAISYVVRINGEEVGSTEGTSLPIVLPADKPYQTYTAHVEAVANGKASGEAISNPVNYGLPLEINPSIHYRPEEWELPLFKAVNVDGKTDSQGNDLTWRYTEDMGFPSFASGYDGDDWLFFPPMLFDNTEKAYQFVMEAGIVHDSDTRGRISVYLGKKDEPEAMTQVILPPHQCEHMRGDDILEYFSVSEPGVYYIGIHAVTYSVSFHISDMDIAITDRSARIPMSVGDLTAEAAPDGALYATVKFTLPSLTASGEPIEENSVDAIVTSYPRTPGTGELGDAVESRTVTGKPGSEQTVRIKTAQNSNLITVTPSLKGNNGATASLILYTGLVRPYIVQNLQAKATEDNMGMTLTWDPPVEGEEDGAIGDSFFYTVWYYNNGWEFGDYVGWNVREYTYTLNPGAEQQWIRLGIMALNDAGQSDHITSVTEVIGTPYTLPMVETFPDYYEEYEPIMVLRPTPEYDNTYWYVDDPADILSPAFANESGVAYIGFVSTDGPEIVNAKSRLSLPKFSTRNLTDITFTLEYFGGLEGAYASQFTILADAYDTDAVTVGSLPKGDGWIEGSLVLPESFNDLDWVEILIDNEYATDQEFAMFCAYSIASAEGSGIDGASDVSRSISAVGSLLSITGYKGLPITVSDLSGRIVVRKERLDDANGFMLAPGVYVVRAGEDSAKVIIR